MELLGKYTEKLLYRWDDKKFEKEYLRRIEEREEEEKEKMYERDWRTGHLSRGEILKER